MATPKKKSKPAAKKPAAKKAPAKKRAPKKVTAPKQRKLTGKQAQFVVEYIVDFNATKAAIRASYSEKTAYSQGQRLLKDVEIKTAIAVAMEERLERTKVDADWVLKRLTAEAEADLAEIYEEDGSLKPIHEWPKIWRTGLVAGLEVEPVLKKTKKDGSEIVLGITKLKVSERIKRIELIGKHIDVQAFKEKHEHTGKDGGPIETANKFVFNPVGPDHERNKD